MIYGSDVQAITDLPDPETICDEVTAAAYACARRWLTPSGALADIGETEQYDSIDVRDWLGARFDLTDQAVISDLQNQARQVLLEEPYVETAQVLAQFNAGKLTLTGQIEGALGPFSLVLAVDGVTTQLLLPGQV